jgi:hypothetical protein
VHCWFLSFVHVGVGRARSRLIGALDGWSSDGSTESAGVREAACSAQCRGLGQPRRLPCALSAPGGPAAHLVMGGGWTARSSTGSSSDDRCDAPAPARLRRPPQALLSEPALGGLLARLVRGIGRRGSVAHLACRRAQRQRDPIRGPPIHPLGHEACRPNETKRSGDDLCESRQKVVNRLLTWASVGDTTSAGTRAYPYQGPLRLRRVQALPPDRIGGHFPCVITVSLFGAYWRGRICG